MLKFSHWKSIFLIICILKSALSNCDKWQCDNGDYICARQACDGKIDCADRSDEIATNCIHQKCQDNEYRCMYGACVPLKHKCDGVKHCADNSDETRNLCIQRDMQHLQLELKGHCSDFEMQCSTEQSCIDLSAICDGQIDCHDHSDESVALCTFRQCQPQEFSCGYGACIHQHKICDGHTDCADESDEAPLLCKRERKIVVPEKVQPERKADCYIIFNRKYLNIMNQQTGLPLNYGDSLQVSETISFQCAKGWVLQGASEKICSHELTAWYADWPSCEMSETDTPECEAREWRCDNGQCIRSAKLCDGIIDCDDKSDEIADYCLRRPECEPHQFRCAYGACVSASAPCNNKTECADWSDEALQLCERNGNVIVDKLQGNCSGDSMLIQCANSARCIDVEAFCDGRPDCNDGDDEVAQYCYKTECPPGMFRCLYGACITQSAVCNGRLECVDGSDEADCVPEETSPGTAAGPATPEVPHTLTPPTTPSGSSTSSVPKFTTAPVPIIDLNKHCQVPKDRRHLNAHIMAQQKTVYAGDAVPSGVGAITFDCDHRWHMQGPAQVFCIGGKWTQEPPTCQKLCSHNTLTRGISTIATCEYNGASLNCSDVLPMGTTAVISCATGYVHLTPQTSKAKQLSCIGAEAEWDYAKPKCIYDCRNPVENEPPTENDDAPVQSWVASIFARTDKPKNSYKRRCPGAILSHKVIISAVPCFTMNTMEGSAANDPTLYEVVIGAHSQNYKITDEISAPRHKIVEIIMPETDTVNIALVILQNYIELSVNVTPLCLQFPAYSRKELAKSTDVSEQDADIFDHFMGSVINYNGDLTLVGQEGDGVKPLIYLEFFKSRISKTLKRFYYML